MNIKNIGYDNCCGCGLCVATCPKHCIMLQQDSEGFYYPVVNDEACVSCGVCLKHCEGHNKYNNNTLQKDAYLGYNKDKNIKSRSSSGGIFFSLALTILQKGGTVYGAAFNDQFSVVHQRIDSVEYLGNLMTSKYVQSDLSGMYELLLQDLTMGKKVLFSGTPCQVAAVRNMVESRKLEENIFLVDFICHGVPSPAIWKSYCQYIDKDNSGIQHINFRNKEKGWHDFRLTICLKNGNVISQSRETNPYMQGFLSDRNIRPSCYHCKHKDMVYASDITLGDAWKIEKEVAEWADDEGTSLFIVRSQKGKEMLVSVSDNITYCQTDYLNWCLFNPSIVKSTSRPNTREEYFEDFQHMRESDFWKKYSQVSLKKYCKYICKRFFAIIGLGKFLRRFF